MKLKTILEKGMTGERGDVSYSEFLLIKEKIEERIEELKGIGEFEDEIEEAELALEDDEITYDELKMVLKILEEL